MLLLYGAVILVFLISENAGSSEETSTSPKIEHPKHGSFDKSALARLIHHVVQDNEEKSDIVKNYKQFPLQPLDLDYFDIRLKQGLMPRNQVQMASGADAGQSGVRFHLIHNPEVLQEYQRNIRAKDLSTSSSLSYDDSLEYDRNVAEIRRNAVFRLGRPDSASIRENPKFALRNGEELTGSKYKKHSREENKLHFGLKDEEPKDEKIEVSFKEAKHTEFHEKSQYVNPSKFNRYQSYNEELRSKDQWEDITKNANKWEEKHDSEKHKKSKHKDEYKNNNDYKKKDSYGNTKKDKFDEYSRWNDKKLKESNDGENKSRKIKDENSWDNWKSKSMEQNEYKRGSGNWKPKNLDDTEKPKKADDWGKLNKDDDWDAPKKDNYWDKPKKGNDWDAPKKDNNWDKPKKDDWDAPKKDNDWDKPKRDNDWDAPKKDDDWDKPKKNNKKHDYDDNWESEKKATKGIASFERGNKNDYVEKDFDKVFTTRSTNEWDRAAAKSKGNVVTNKKPYVPKISDYYNPRPRIHENPAALGFKTFGRTSIPFVGKKGIYEEK